MRSHAQKSRTPIIIIVALVVLVGLGGVYFWYSKQNNKQVQASIDPNTASTLSEGLKSIEKQDQAQAETQEAKLVVDPAVGQSYTVIRPLEELSADDQAKSKQALGGGTMTTLAAFGLAKKDGEGDTARSLYNSGYFIYKLDGKLKQSSTEAVVKDKAAAEIKSYNQGNDNPDSPYTYTNGNIEASGDITIKTTGDETITLPVSKYKQTIKSKSNPAVQKQIVRVLAAAKLGDRLLLINMAGDEPGEFGKETANLQAMAAYVKLELTK